MIGVRRATLLRCLAEATFVSSLQRNTVAHSSIVSHRLAQRTKWCISAGEGARTHAVRRNLHAAPFLGDQVQEAYGHRDVDALKVDASLFEDDDWQYAEAKSDELKGWKQHSRYLLVDALKEHQFDHATTLLREMQLLQADIEPSTFFFDAAEYWARKGDLGSSILWLKLVPPLWMCRTPKQRNIIRKSIARTLGYMRTSSDWEQTCHALLYLARKGYVEGQGPSSHAFDLTLSWLFEHAYHIMHEEPMGRPFDLWSKHFFQQFVNLSYRGHLEKEGLALVDTMQALPRTPESIDFRRRLGDLFNKSIRALCRARRFDAAWAWIQMDERLGKESYHRRNNDTAFFFGVYDTTLYVFLNTSVKGVISVDETVELRTRKILVNSLIRKQEELEECDLTKLRKFRALGQQFSEDEMLKTQRDRRACLERTVRSLVKEAQVDRAIALLQDAQQNDAFVPNEQLLLHVWRAVHRDENLNETLGSYLTTLAEIGGRLVLIRLDILRYLDEQDARKALSTYFAHFADPQLISLAQGVLQEQGSIPTSNDALWLEKLHVNPYTSAIGLQCLIEVVKSDAKKLDDLYTQWIASVAHHQRRPAFDEGEVDEERSSASLREIDKDTFNVFEPTNQASLSAIPPVRYHFLVFMRRLPRALTRLGRQALRKSESERTDMECDAHRQACQRAFQILRDAERFGFAPNRGLLTLLLDTLARNADVYNVHEDNFVGDVGSTAPLDVQRVFVAAKLLGINVDENEMDVDPALRATPLTYAFLIRAFLSVPVKRGGPMVREAEEVQRCYEADEHAQRLAREESFSFDGHIERAKEYLQVEQESYASRREMQEGSEENDVNEEEDEEAIDRIT